MRNINLSKPEIKQGVRWVEIATAIRREIDDLRSNPGRVSQWLSVIAWRYETAVTEGKTFVFVPPEGQVVINSNLR